MAKSVLEKLIGNVILGIEIGTGVTGILGTAYYISLTSVGLAAETGEPLVLIVILMSSIFLLFLITLLLVLLINGYVKNNTKHLKIWFILQVIVTFLAGIALLCNIFLVIGGGLAVMIAIAISYKIWALYIVRKYTVFLENKNTNDASNPSTILSLACSE